MKPMPKKFGFVLVSPYRFRTTPFTNPILGNAPFASLLRSLELLSCYL
jgi:hypothetical protein